jgi:hypothetical protein
MKMDDKYFEGKFKELFHGFPEVTIRKNILKQIARDQREADAKRIGETFTNFMRNGLVPRMGDLIAALREEDK